MDILKSFSMPKINNFFKKAGFTGGLALFTVVFAGFLFSCAGGAGADNDTEGFDLENRNSDVQEPTAGTAMAAGGSISFVPVGDDWDEVHTFVYDGEGDQQTYTLLFSDGAPSTAIPAQLLVIAGGGAGGSNTSHSNLAYYAGGGGAGGVIYYGSETPTGYTPFDASYSLSDGSYTVKVGRGGKETAWQNSGENGKNSSFGELIAAGGGGAGGVAPTNTSSTEPGNGGPGIDLSISGAVKGYAGGGASGKVNTTSALASHGGGVSGQPGASGTGGGGSGSHSNVYQGQPGGSGIVIVRFPWTAPPQ